MGKRSWLTERLNNEILPSIAQLNESDEGKAQCQKLAQSLRDYWIEHGQTDLKQQQSLMDQTRRAIKDKFGEDHFSLDFIKFTTEEYTRLNDEKQRSVQSVAIRHTKCEKVLQLQKLNQKNQNLNSLKLLSDSRLSDPRSCDERCDERIAKNYYVLLCKTIPSTDLF